MDDIIEELPGCPDRYARVSEVSMNMMAAPVVSLLIKVLPPPAPKTDWLPLAPKDAPISAPFPDCRRTIAISAMLTVMCSIIKRIVIIGFSSRAIKNNI